MDYAAHMTGNEVQIIPEKKKTNASEELFRTVRLYLEDAENKNTIVNRLLRYIDNEDETGINNMFLNAKNENVKASYNKFLLLCGTEKRDLQKQFDNLYGHLLAVYK